jgi:uncharacterized repeat protein (TIGR03803 family)
MRRICLLALAALFAASPLLAQTPTVVYTFTGMDGAQPVGNFAQLPGGNMIGVTSAGGANDYGVVYNFNPSTLKVTDIYSFTDGVDGATPNAGVTLGPDGSAYGTALYGGQYGEGTLWKISSLGMFTNLYSFGMATGDGANPNSNLIWGSDGNLWGTTGYGGTNQYGTAFNLSPSGTYKKMHDFTASDGESPAGGLLLASDGNFYGTTQYGGEYGYGTVFKMTLLGKVTVLWNFTGGDDGGYPCAGLEEDEDGNLWGDTMVGGDFGYGTEFYIDYENDHLTTTYDYDDDHGNNPDFAPFLGGDGNFYGETNEGGSGYGTFYEVNPSMPTKFSFITLDGADGAFPAGGFFQGQDGYNYTTTQYGGSETNQGFILKMEGVSLIPDILAIALSKGTIDLGDEATLTWGVNVGYSDSRKLCFALGNDTAEWSGWQMPTGTLTVKPTEPGTYTYALVCDGMIDNWTTLNVSAATKYATTTVLTAPANVISGSKVTLTATVTPAGGGTPTGTVDFQFGGKTFTSAALSSGVATVTLSSIGIPTGTFSLTAVYGGDETHNGSTSAAVPVVLKEGTLTTVAPSPTGPITQGKPLTLTASVTGGSGTQRPTGDVTFTATINNTPVEFGPFALNSSQQAIFNVNTDNLPAGSFPVTATYNGDATFAASTSPAIDIEIKAASSTSVKINPNPAAAGTSITMTASVQGSDPTGTVTFSAGNLSQKVNLAGGDAVFSYTLPTSLPGGNYTVTASYSGDTNNSPSSGTTALLVLGSTSTVLTATPDTVAQGSSTILSASVSSNATSLPAPTGTVEFLFHGDSLGTGTLSGSGVATLKAQVTTFIAPGTYNVEANYGGDANHTGSSGFTAVTVTK